METNCIHLSEEWKPKWIIKNSVEYNATHPDDKPNQYIVNADTPLLPAKTQYKTNADIVEKEDDYETLEQENQHFEEDEVADDLIVDTEDIYQDVITPKAGMTNVNSSTLTNNLFSMLEESSESSLEDEY